MPLTAQQEFKVGYLARGIHEGWSPAQMLEFAKAAEAQLDKILEKQALFGEIAGKGIEALGNIASTAAGWAIPAAVLAPPAIGALGGYGLARAMDVDDTDVREMKQRELEDEYKRQTLSLARQREARQYRKARNFDPANFGTAR